MISFYGILETLTNASISTLGAFIPIFCLMYIHYRIRKSGYKKRKQRMLQLKKFFQALLDTNNKFIQEVYASIKVKNFQELLDKVRVLKATDNKFQYTKLVGNVAEQLNAKTKNLEKITKITLDISYIDKYNFKAYLGTLLDRRFPDKKYK